MQGKIMFALGAAIGYVVGTKQGREGYERMRQRATEMWQNPRVQRTVADVQDFARDAGSSMSEKVSEATRKMRGADGAPTSTMPASGMSTPTTSPATTPGAASGV